MSENRPVEKKITLRNVYKLPKGFMEPAIDPSTNRYAPHVKRVDSNGDMILSEADKAYDGILIAENEMIEIYDGKTFDLEDPFDLAWWNAIKFSKRITQERQIKNSKGEYVIDGNVNRYGTAEFYVERVGEQSKAKVDIRKQRFDASQFIFTDSKDGLYQKAKLLGNPMHMLPITDVEEYLLQIAHDTPSKIKELYTGEDTHLRLLLLDAIDKYVIRWKDKLYQYGDSTILGASQEAAILWFKNPNNKRMLDLIKEEVYPDYYKKVNPIVKDIPVDLIDIKNAGKSEEVDEEVIRTSGRRAK